MPGIGRKVRAPPSRVLGNTQEGRPYGKCHRNIPPAANLALARVKWRGKSSPAARRLAGGANPTRSKTKQRAIKVLGQCPG